MILRPSIFAEKTDADRNSVLLLQNSLVLGRGLNLPIQKCVLPKVVLWRPGHMYVGVP